MVKVSSILMVLAVAFIATEAVAAAPAHTNTMTKKVVKHHKTSPHAKHPAVVVQSKTTKKKAPKKTTKEATKTTKKAKKTTKKKNSTKKKIVKKPSKTKPKSTKKKNKTKNKTKANDNITEILKLHNDARAKHQAPAVTWNTTLASFAQEWASKCHWQHSDNGKWAENLALGFASWDASIGVWYGEQSKYDYNHPGFSTSTGHFTQIVWKSTTEIGCATASCPNIGGTFYICEYNPPGKS
ncbi:CAP domain-containing protein [Jimgerdemannia flammicorona]|uniref:CAP domain-containing protein n=2 Tax=Jimgerdemannia flammicorona TaxID=994334 RepID=A0A433QEQ1_9FUNG|nr:CAP domain-containing protein [Jimgerdemannia flammicorona]RUS28306.1 CAP domain-containing protein [Jimgerdemannia flammicorona]